MRFMGGIFSAVLFISLCLFASPGTVSHVDDFTRNDESGYQTFYTFETCRKQLVDWATANSTIVKLDTLGKSQGGKPIWVFYVSGAADTAPRQRFYINGACHGNENIGTEIIMWMAKDLITKYATDVKIKQIVDRSEFVFHPIVNPDGFIAKRRSLNDGKDGNRCFGFQVGETGESLPYGPPEMKVTRTIFNQASPTFSVDYHCGMESLMKAFFGGITMECDKDAYTKLSSLYPIPGHQRGGISCDASAGKNGALAFLPEVCPHNPPASNISKIATHNYDCVMKCIDELQKGVCGVVTDAKTGAGLCGRVTVKGAYAPIPTMPKSGAYFKYMVTPTGTIEVSAYANGYKPQSATVAANASGFAKLDFKMEPDPTLKYGAITIDAARCDNKMGQSALYSCLELHDGKSTTLQMSGSTKAYIDLDFGQSRFITDREGIDISVFATGKYTVKAALDFNKLDETGSTLGTGDGNATFDLKTAGIKEARFVQILVTSGSVVLDAVEAEPDGQTFVGNNGNTPSADCERIRIIPGYTNNKVSVQAYIPQGRFSIAVYDCRGHRIAALMNGYAEESGVQSRSLNMRRLGNLSSGTYIVHVTSAAGDRAVKGTVAW